MSLIEVIKEICNETVKASKPMELVIGSVLSINPFQVKIDQRLILTDAHLSGDYNPDSYSIGDGVSLLRIQGGKKYYVLPTVTTGGTTSGVKIEYDADNENLIVGA